MDSKEFLKSLFDLYDASSSRIREGQTYLFFDGIFSNLAKIVETPNDRFCWVEELGSKHRYRIWLENKWALPVTEDNDIDILMYLVLRYKDYELDF